MSVQPLLTNIFVGHDQTSCGFVKHKVCNECLVRVINVGDSQLKSPFSSPALAESRGFLMTPPDEIETKYVSFNSSRVVQKSGGRVSEHSACNLVGEMLNNDVISPYLLRQKCSRLLEPEVNAPPYAFGVPPIWESILEAVPSFRTMFDLYPNRVLLLPFCNSFVIATAHYAQLRLFLIDLISRCWQTNEFNYKWCELWSSSFPGREYGLLIERATALWLAYHPDLRILGSGFGTGYPSFIEADGKLEPTWLEADHDSEFRTNDSGQYN